MSFEQFHYAANFAAMETVIFDDRPIIDVNQYLITAANHMYMRRIVIFWIDYNIIAMTPSVQNCNHRGLGKSPV